MERRQLIFMDASSSKFWNIELNGSSHTVTYGRTGTNGQTKTKDFDSDEKAKASYDKLVKQKLAKGYSDAGDATESDSDSLPASAFHSVIKEEDIGENVKTFIGKRVADYKPKKAPVKGGKTIYRFRGDWENDTLLEDFEHFLGTDAAAEASGIVIGRWGGEDGQDDNESVVAALVKAANRLTSVKAIFLGDICQEENEISWIQQSDVSPLLKAYPDLEVLRVRGGSGLEIKKPAHAQLRALAIESGGLSADVVRSICTSKMPNLEHLELWLGTEEYGGGSSVQDLQPILSGNLFPKLKYLGFRNCEYADDIAGVVVNSPIIERIETLDLSLGVLTDVGAEALLSIPQGGSLKKVSMHHHYATAPVLRKLKALDVTFDTSGSQDDDDDWRFVAVGE